MLQQLQTGYDSGHHAQKVNVRPKKESKKHQGNHQMHERIVNGAFQRNPSKVSFFEYPIDMNSIEMD